MSLFDLNHLPVTEGADQHQNPTPTSPDLFRNCRGDCLSKQSLHHESKQDSVLLLSDESSHPLTLHDTAAADCEQGESHGSDGKWTMMPSSEMRIMKKMIMVMMTTGCKDSPPRGSMQIVPKGQSQADDTSRNNCSVKSATCSSSSMGGVVRACTNCNTTRTPLWRTGPYGPKSLCNACGIRQRKARRAMEAAALKRGGGGGGGGGLALDAPNNRLKKEEKSSMIYHTVPFKKRCKFKYSSSLSSSSVHDQKKKLYPQVLPKDERDAAMLLMGLSCGLIRSNL